MITTIFSGLAGGAIYALVGLLLTIPMARGGNFNFALAFYVVLAGFIASDLSGARLSPWLTLLILLAGGGLLGLLQDVLTVRPLKEGGDGDLITTIGLAILIQGAIAVRWGAVPRTVPFFTDDDPITVLGGRAQPVDFWLIGTALVVGLVLFFAARFTRWGLVGRAVTTDKHLAALRGISAKRVQTAAYVVSGAGAFALALLVTPKTGVDPNSGLTLIIFAFAGMAIGGLATYQGALVGGLIIGLVDAFVSRYLNTDAALLAVFIVLAAALLFRPKGIFGRRTIRIV